jgi:integrase
MVVKREYEDLRGDGNINLFLREGKKPKYYVRISTPNSTGYKFISTKTNNKSEAIRFAFNEYDKLNNIVQSGGVLQSRTYKDIVDEWGKNRTNSYNPKSKSKDRTVEYVKLYSVDFFGKMMIDKIKSKDFHEYCDWRNVNYKKKQPTVDTINRELTSIRSVFKYSYQRGYISEMVTIQKLKTNGVSRRSTFNLTEWKKITTGMRKWVKEGKPLGKYRDRFILQQYVLLMSNSGVRVGEMRDLKWEDVTSYSTKDGDDVILKVKGKTGLREAVLNPGSERSLQRLFDLRKEELDGVRPSPNEYVFLSRLTGKPYTSFKTSFNSMLKYCGIELEKDGLNRTIYSLRHFYGTQRLKGNISPYILAKQMGTSVEMIEKHYSHVLTKDRIKLIKESVNKKRSDTTSTENYPW